MNRETSPLAFDTGWRYDPAPESTDHVTIDERYGLFIDGGFVSPRNRRYSESINPANGEVIASVYSTSQADYDRLLDMARESFRTWRMTPAPVRGNAVRNHPDIMLVNRNGGAGWSSLVIPQVYSGAGDDAYAIDHDGNGLDDFLVLNGHNARGPTQLVAFYRR